MSRHQRLHELAAVVWLTGLVVMTAPAASSHPAPTRPDLAFHNASDHFPTKWTVPTVQFWFVSSFPTNAVLPFRTRVIEGAGNWNPAYSERPSMLIWNGANDSYNERSPRVSHDQHTMANAY
jgi:hypothetical protein